ncbi:hypothetical protein [Nioella sp.]|uniref:hypothetical protein n=1 Tax=Nioella sp. TaxID=1912091 RepID=UPI0035133218
MPVENKTFSYEVEGLSYIVTVYEDPANPGQFLAEIEVTEGAMDVNAIYFGDDDFSGSSASLGGSLNMNGSRLGDEEVQWDNAVYVSDPGLGPDGDEKASYLEAGDDPLVWPLSGVTSLDDIDVLGIRATSTTNDAGSIKGVSEEEEEDPTFDKVGFGWIMDDYGIAVGVYFTEDDLPEGEEGTFENYVNHYVSIYGENEDTDPDADPDFNLSEVQSVIFYELSPVDGPIELFRIDAPEDVIADDGTVVREGGFQSADDLLDAYDAAIEGGALDAASGGDEGLELMAALSLDEVWDETMPSGVEMDEEDFELA